MTFSDAMHEIGVAAGFGILEARGSRLGVGVIDYIDRAMISAGIRCRKRLRENFIIEDPARPNPVNQS